MLKIAGGIILAILILNLIPLVFAVIGGALAEVFAPRGGGNG